VATAAHGFVVAHVIAVCIIGTYIFFNPLQRTGICASSSNLEIGEEVLFVLSLYEEEAAACSS
jgi:hypothetical protein